MYHYSTLKIPFKLSAKEKKTFTEVLRDSVGLKQRQIMKPGFEYRLIEFKT